MISFKVRQLLSHTVYYFTYTGFSNRVMFSGAEQFLHITHDASESMCCVLSQTESKEKKIYRDLTRANFPSFSTGKTSSDSLPSPQAPYYVVKSTKKGGITKGHGASWEGHARIL